MNIVHDDVMLRQSRSVAERLWQERTPLPRMCKIKQRLVSRRIKDLQGSIRSELKRVGLRELVRPGWRVAVTAGSRGISRYREILAAVVDELKKVGARPYIVPTMGSHGGATAGGQRQVLRHLGVTARSVGAPIIASMDVEAVGHLSDEVPVFVSKDVLSADAILVVNRVKPHTDFKDEIESGLMKMMVIGIGKAKGAAMMHSLRKDGYHKYLRLMARAIMEKAPILLGLAVVEDGYHDIAAVKAIRPDEIEREEKTLLVEAKRMLPKIPFKELEVLIVDEIGKNISGLGMDTNVTGRFWIPGEAGPDLPKIERIVVRDITEESGGNAIGVGLADFITERAFRKIDLYQTYINSLTAGWPEIAGIPVTFPTDREAIVAALRTSSRYASKDARVVRIKNTLELETMDISQSLLEDVTTDETFQDKINVIGRPHPMRFNQHGALI